MKSNIRVLSLVILSATLFVGTGTASEVRPWDGSLIPPVHRIPIVDENGMTIVPQLPDSMPFSARRTCGPCHDYGRIGGGLHFNSYTTESSENASGRPEEPWIWVDEETGTQIPISYRRLPGTYRPEEVGLSPWKFTEIFGRHLPGGNMSEPTDPLLDPESHWDVVGPIEINCLGCHNESYRQDQSEWAKQISRENYRWAATSASGLGEVKGMASRMPKTWASSDGPDPDDLVWAVPPSVDYDMSQFDNRGKAFFDISRKPKDERCLYCHSVSPVGKERWTTEQDVHSSAGVQCVDCHRNGIDHRMIRGYENESKDLGDPAVHEFTCEGCHLGNSEKKSIPPTAGRLGAPRPEHKNLPVIHFDKLTCTACHSGPWPKDELSQVRTSRANRLGIHGVAQWFTDAPYIGEPVFIKGTEGKIAPQRVVWPAFWGRMEGDKVVPLLPDVVKPAAEGILDAGEQIGNVLKLMSFAMTEASPEDNPGALGEAVFMTPGFVYHLDSDGGVASSVYSGTMTIDEPQWAREKDGAVLPILTQFDPDKFNPIENEQDSKTEELILSILRALDGKGMSEFPAGLEIGDKIFRRGSQRTLEPDAGTPKVELTEEEQAKLDKELEALTRDEEAKTKPYLVVQDRIFRWKVTQTLEVVENPGGKSTKPFWGRLKNGKIGPLVSDFVVRAVTETTGSDGSFTEEQVGLVLDSLAKTVSAGSSVKFVYVSGGKMFAKSGDQGLSASDHPAAKPYFLPLAHNVRPVSQSLGAAGCADCHAVNAPFFFSTFKGTGPLKTDKVASVLMRGLQGESKPVYIQTSRVFKWFIIVIMSILILHIIADFIRRMFRRAKA